MEATELVPAQVFELAATKLVGPQPVGVDASNKCMQQEVDQSLRRNIHGSVSVCETISNNNNNAKIANLVSPQQQHQPLQDSAQVEQQVEHQSSTTAATSHQIQQQHHHQQQQKTTNNNNATTNNVCQNASSSTSVLSNCVSSNCSKESGEVDQQVNAKDFGRLTKETQELKIRTRKLQLEIDEKNEIINILKDELETTKEQNAKFQRDNLQLLKDSKRVKFLQDENDFIQDKTVKLELELNRLKEKLITTTSETEFLKLRIGELGEDKTRAQEESAQFEEKWQKAEQGLARVTELETELNKWKLFSHELELERNSIQSKLLESIEQEAKLNSTNRQVEDEVKRLRSLIKSYEEQRDEEQASNSLIMNVSDLKLLDQQQQQQQSAQQIQDSDILETTVTDTSIKFEIDQQLEKELNEENKNLKQKMNEQEIELNKLIETNQEIRDELENNKKLISDLRQDLACEKSLASKLTKQLMTFTKQIKNLDKQYFPMHDTSTQQQQSPPLPISSSSPSIPNAAIVPSPSFITHEQANDRKSRLTNGNIINNKSYEHEEKESSLSKSVTPLEYQRQQQSKDTVLSASSTCENDKKKPNERQASNSNYNETRQRQVDFTNGSKLSVPTKELGKNYPQPDNDFKLGKQGSSSSSSISKDILETQNNRIESPRSLSGQEVSQCSAQTSAVTNKSTAAALENPNKDKVESCCTRGGLLFTASNNNHSGKLDSKQPLETNDRSELAFEKISSSPLIDGEDEAIASRKYVNGANSISISSSGNSTQNRLTNVSPSSYACSQSSSPSATVTVGHDSGFQSINHDFNHQLSSPNVEVRKISTSGRSAASIDSPEVPISADSGTAKKQLAAPIQTNRSTPITVQGGARPVDLEDATTTTTTNNCCHHPETPTTSVGNRVPIVVAANVTSTTLGSAINSPYSGRSSYDGSHQEQRQISLADAKTAPTALPLASTSVAMRSDPIHLAEQESNAFNDHHQIMEDSTDTVDASATDGSTKLERSRSSKGRSFVRNSLPSRSVNFGHSKSSAYLDRIRASVTATTITNTTSSFNERTRNIVLATQPGQPLSANDHQHHLDNNRPRYLLNCMLDHQHVERCFVANDHHASHVAASQQPVSANHDGHHAIHRPILQSSRQLNALIDPVSNDQLMMSLLHHPNHVGAAAATAAPPHHLHHQVHPTQGGQYLPPLNAVGGDLTEQQIARLTSLHHQHYYHHLQQMHQLHQLHHQHHMHVHHHRMHHRYKQQQQQQQQQQSASGSQPVVAQQDGSSLDANKIAQRRLCEQPIYSGGSQFYAPSAQFDQIYSSMTANNNNNNNSNPVNDHHRTRLVTSSSSSSSSNGNQMQSPETAGLRSSPNNHCRPSNRIGPHKMKHQPQQPQQQPTISGHYATLPQIDEVNGLPTVESVATQSAKHQHRASPIRQHRSAQVVMTSEAIAKAQQHNSSSNGSPSSSSSSPTSSASSNLSPSSASSSSSLNSLSTSTAPLNRSAAWRHTTTELNRRQFSIERELDGGALPMTATLSRVGSCRVNRSTADDEMAAQSLCNHHNSILNNNNTTATTSPQVKDATQMRTPVKSQQPSMRTSKILNISQQSGPQLPLAHHHQQQQLSNQLGTRRTATQATGTGGADKLASNLANIRLNDNLAFASLRAPKNCSGASGINRSLTNNGKAQTQTTANTKVLTSSSKPSCEKHKLTDKQAASDGGKPSEVWFEYGCV